MLHEFIAEQHEELIERARSRLAARPGPRATHDELANGVPLFLNQLSNILKQEAAQSAPDGTEMGATATLRGGDLLKRGFSIAQVVQDYGDICQAITELALDLGIPVATEDFQTLNRCLDNAIANAVTEYARQSDLNISGAETERQGIFAHELRNHLNTAMLAFQVVKSGKVGLAGSTTDVLDRSLRHLRDIVNRSVAEVRLDSGTHQKERLRLGEFIEELQIDASVNAKHRGVEVLVAPVDYKLRVDVDRHLFASAISNVLQNAIKFTRPSGRVWLRTKATATHVSIEVEDECGGLPPGVEDAIFLPFEQRGTDRAGMGLGLPISRQAIESDGGTISVQDGPGKGCTFVVRIPLAAGEPPARGKLDV